MVELIQQLGVPVGLLLIVLIAVWRGFTYLAAHVIEPVVGSHLKANEAQIEKGKIDSDNIRQQTSALKALMDLGVSGSESLEDLHGKADKLLERSTCRKRGTAEEL